MTSLISRAGNCARKYGVPLRSENSLRQARHRTNRMSPSFPVQRTNRTFPAPRLPASEHSELTQHRSETSIGLTLIPAIPPFRHDLGSPSVIGKQAGIHERGEGTKGFRIFMEITLPLVAST